ncbi:MAG: UDP-N-acetylmuramate--L-alanine ligase [Candidatus Sericytochromatia bacterium]
MLDSFDKIHFIGIGGIGMSGLARILLSQGKQVSGSDLKLSPLLEELGEAGAKVYAHHDPTHLPEGTEYVAVSTAISKQNPEYLEALRRGIPIIHRSEVLRYLLATSRGISVTGTHGKTTTSALLSLILVDQGLDPTIVIGGEIPQLGTNARAGTGEFTVAEVDESDQSLRRLSTEFALITNLEVDHLDHYQGLDEIIEAVLEFISNQPENGKIMINIDDPGNRLLIDRLPVERRANLVSFGLHATDADYRGINPQLSITGSSFEVEHQGVSIGRFELGIPGFHNIYNALTTITCAHVLNFNLAQVAESLKSYRGVKRRFQLIGELPGDVKVIDDYGHHPSEIRATLSTAKLQNRPITAVFQPHRYSRTQALLGDFAKSFELADRIILTQIYAASENPEDFQVDIQQLVELTRQENPDKSVLYFEKIEDIRTFLLQNLIPRELILTIGAGNITELSRLLVGKSRAAKAEHEARPETKSETKIVYAPVSGLSPTQRQVV